MIIAPKHHFIHVPKTGGTFVFKAIKALGIPYSGSAFNHDQVPSYRASCSYFVCIRDPADWMCSQYYHRKRHNWNWLNRKLENRCKATSLTGFFENLSLPENRDIVLDYYRYFLGNLPKDKITYLRTKFLNKDLSAYLKSIPIVFDERLLLAMPAVHRKAARNKLSISCSLRDRFISNNAGFYNMILENKINL